MGMLVSGAFAGIWPHPLPKPLGKRGSSGQMFPGCIQPRGTL